MEPDGQRPLGDGQTPSDAIMNYEVINAKTGMGVGEIKLLGTISSSSSMYAGGSQTFSDVSPNTLHYIHYYGSPAGRQAQTFGRRCSMTAEPIP